MSNRDNILSSSLVLLILFVFISTSSYAGNRRSPDELPWYEIEILIFANIEQKGLDTETWPENDPSVNYDHLINLRFPKKINRATFNEPKFSPDTTLGNSLDGQNDVITDTDIGLPEAFAFIKKSEFRLSALRKKLTSSPQFEPLMHLGWRQPTAKPKKALPVYLYLGIDDPNYLSALGAASSSPARQSSNIIGFQPNMQTDGPVGAKNSRFYGALTLSVSRYLHVNTDLHYRVPVLQQEYVLEPPGTGFFDSTAEPVERLIERNVLLDFGMVESRRMRSKEVHFFDHPMFGMIVLITPVDVTGDS